MLTKLQNSISEKFANATINDHEKRVLKLLSHDNKTNLHDSLKQNQDSKLPSLEQTMEIAIQLTDFRGNEKNMSNHCKICDRPHEVKMSDSSEDNLQLRIDREAASQKKPIKEKVHVCPKGAYT